MVDSQVPMRVKKYIPDRMYGFAVGADGQDVFFHLRVFRPGHEWGHDDACRGCGPGVCAWVDTPPGPILGERVLVVLHPEASPAGSAPRAERVDRVDTPVAIAGDVDTFDAQRGYGFVKGEDGVAYHLHRSEVVGGRVPLPGRRVLFYPGVRQERPRACHVKVCDEQS